MILLLGLLEAGENLAPGRLAQVPTSPRTAWTSWLRAQQFPNWGSTIPARLGYWWTHTPGG